MVSVPMDANSIATGVTRSFQTGNMALDMAISTVICLLLPIITTHVIQLAKQWYHILKAWLLQDRRPRVCRTIATKSRRNMYGSLYKDDENHILQKAILLYIQDFKERWQHTAETAEVSLLDTDVNDDDNDSEDEEGGAPSYLERQLKRLSVVTTPVDEVEIEIEPGLFFTRDTGEGGENGDNNRDKKEDKTQTVTITISTERNDAAVHKINNFVDRAYQRYQASLSSGHKKRKRYMLMMASKSGGKGDGDEDKKKKKGSALVGPFNKFELSEDKTFESLFIPQKASLMQLLKDFTHQSGKFAIKGFPRKLGLLLHGPPGTGKTSLIKAIAQHTGRHVVNVSLKRLRTNEQLFNLMYGREFDVIGEDMAMRLPFSKLIFVMEDIDAASDIVKRRVPSSPPASHKRAKTNPNPPLNTDEIEPKAAPVVGSLKSEIGPSALADWLKDEDELDLAGLLNALDGVVDCPGRMVIMTTNHPEKLDPALIRPGRVNMQLHLDYMRTQMGVQMVEHYFAGALSDVERQQLEMAFPDMTMTPAQVEELCAEKGTIPQLVAALECARDQSSKSH